MTKLDNNNDASGEYRNILDHLGKTLESLSRKQKRQILMSVDVVIFALCLYLALILRLGHVDNQYLVSLFPAFIFVSVFGVFSNLLFGVYKTLNRSFDFRSVNILASSCVAVGLAIAAFGYFFNNIFLPRSTPFIYIMLAFLLVGTSRILARWLYQYSLSVKGSRKAVMIYGAGEAGNKVAGLLSGSPEFSLVGFVDDDPTLHGNYMRGRKVYSPSDISSVVSRYGPLKVLLSILDLSPSRKRQIYSRLRHPQITIEVMPSLLDVVAGRLALDSLRELQIEDLLGRDIVPPIASIFSNAVKDATVLVTGGGGSIGSEICRQIVNNNPSKLIVFDQSEFALYGIEQELSSLVKSASLTFPIHYVLGSVDNRDLVARILKTYSPDMVFHAAAYKHVPIVEDNILEGARNNILGTEVIASECAAAGVERFILISTDKAVRPTNVMGATKRVAELVVQSQAEISCKKGNGTIFSMVRFGNVLGSSGSVIPVFKSQISNGGPVTVTHKDVTRYFMTIPEAAQLVVQAAFMAEGGEVFVLDMGDPVKIDDLAKLAIQLSGLTVRSEEEPNGDIEIKYIGLRPGEKLFEELLTDENAQGTIHPKIMKANENHLANNVMKKHTESLKKAVVQGDQKSALKILMQIVPGFSR
ncbi:MAG: nucleoside-diphosphate sugar epimerase/dehydratase [Salaquimonas sp.]